ncbi:ABC transporter permease [Enterococcus phoeniculicola]|uniref:ABC transporter permease n=1 Tax=Enterococcus phoeniculicola ATCC BAA-412 TaxID=1158610 RepID=R3TPN5_9ENTE|nr:ABC transporter permease [Enterococcus phoeniculicola]EOL43023.1 hypothetical protein UC3_02000 [Enterococcus phoeniculicola ATCC BAA-412]EOT76619.1 hypothetical protein I589_01576 [Enterococcus phoeniculicola ATCC BAA-412]
MGQLMKLEIEKFKLQKQMIGVLITILGIMVFLTVSFVDTYTDASQQLDSSQNIRWMINLLNTGAFLVYSSTMVSKIVVNEYSRGTIYVLFSYPINRIKLMLSKIILIFLFTVCSTILGDVLCTLYVNLINANVQVMTSMIGWDSEILSLYIFGSILGGILSTIPFVTGMYSKSTSVPIVTSVILVAVMQALIGRNPEILTTIWNLVLIAGIVILLATYTLIKKV